MLIAVTWQAEAALLQLTFVDGSDSALIANDVMSTIPAMLAVQVTVVDPPEETSPLFGDPRYMAY